LIQRKTQTVRGRPASAFFRRVALKGWDANHFTFTHKYPPLRRWLTAQVSGRKTILAVGCGRGELERDLVRLGHHVISLDFSFAMVWAAAMHYKLQAVVQADAHVLPFRAASFDLMILPESLGYLEAEVAFREAARILKNTGRLMMTTYPPHQAAHAPYKKLSSEAIADLLQQAGFIVQEQRFLVIRHRAITEMFPDEGCDLMYVSAKKRVQRAAGQRIATRARSLRLAR
jgi:ubiquinone/menaquinone biosynthesis C-methylase UbiE